MTTMYEHVGGEAALRKFVEEFHAAVLADPLLAEMFANSGEGHVDHLTAFFVEVLGGPARYTGELGGFNGLASAHFGLRIEEPGRRRFVELMLAAADSAGLPDDERFRNAFASQVDRGAGFSMKASHLSEEALAALVSDLGRWTW